MDKQQFKIYIFSLPPLDKQWENCPTEELLPHPSLLASSLRLSTGSDAEHKLCLLVALHKYIISQLILHRSKLLKIPFQKALPKYVKWATQSF